MQNNHFCQKRKEKTLPVSNNFANFYFERLIHHKSCFFKSALSIICLHVHYQIPYHYESSRTRYIDIVSYFTYLTKSLWTSVKIAENENINQLPDSMHIKNIQLKKEEIPEAFAEYFGEKVKSITETRLVENNVYN